jgi:hypothetical protein
MFWNEERLNRAESVLSSCESVLEACVSISEEFGEDITADSLYSAFKRHGKLAPSSYLLNVKVEKESEEAEESDSTASFDYKIDFAKSLYRFWHNNSPCILTFEDVEQACFLYSAVDPGRGLTSREVAQYFLVEKGYDWISEDFIVWMFKRIGVSKMMSPAAPHQRFNSVEEVMQSMAMRQDALIKSSMKVNQIKEQQKEIRRLQAKLEEIEQALNIAEGLKSAPIARIEPAKPLQSFGRTVVIPLCDSHSGKHIRPKTDIAKEHNRFNAKIFKERVERFCACIQELATKVPKDVDHVYVLNLGDDTESILGNMREGMLTDQYNHGFEQYKEAIWLNVNIVESTLKAFPCGVTFVKTGSNHERLAKNKEPNTDEVFAQIALDRISCEFKDEDRFKGIYGHQVFSILLPNGVCVIGTHGHLKTWAPSNASDVINIHGIPGARRYILLQAHQHHLSVYSGYNYRLIKLPSLVGNDDYNLISLLTGAPPECLFLEITDGQDLLHGPYRLDLDQKLHD